MTAHALNETEKWRTVRFDVLERIEEMPSLSRVVTEFLALARRDVYSARDFEAVLSKDQALVARLLKLANSGIYGRSRTVRTIPEAVVLIGLEHLKKVVYAVSAAGLVRHALRHYGYHPDQGFWLHGLAVAQAARVVAEASRSCPLRPEEAYVAGLLHDVGKLVIDEFLDLPAGSHATVDQERDAVGLDHAELAEYILHQWNLPEAITASVRWHHDHTAGGDAALGAAALHLGEVICRRWRVGYERPIDLGEDVPQEDCAEVMEMLGIPPTAWGQVIWDIRQRLVTLEDTYAGA
ncbi:MAG: HDOD domain-containing protein [Candidatus Krumholzibacteriia bacterium]